MLARRIVLPTIALLLAGSTAYLARNWVESQRRPVDAAQAPEPAERKAVLVAATALEPGQFLQAEAMRWQDWPDVSLPETYIVKGTAPLEDFAGAVVRQPVAIGQPLTKADMVKPGDRGFLAAVLEPGMRAVSVPVDEASSNAGLIFPGDRVDLILTQTIGGEGGGEGGAKAPTRRVSETVLRDVRVIAMGRKLHNEAGEESLAADKVRTTTLEVDAGGAEKVALVTELGKLSLSLRSLAKDGDAAPAERSFTWDSDVARSLLPENQPGSTLAVIRGRESQIVNLSKGVP
jgi:pilus assembly protein CpaB